MNTSANAGSRLVGILIGVLVIVVAAAAAGGWFLFDRGSKMQRSFATVTQNVSARLANDTNFTGSSGRAQIAFLQSIGSESLQWTEASHAELARFEFEIANAYYVSRGPKQAQEAVSRGADAYSQLNNVPSETVVQIWERWASATTQAQHHLAKKQGDEAIAQFDAALDAATELVATDPESVVFRRAVLNAVNGSARLAFEKKDDPRAKANYERIVAEARDLIERAPYEVSWARENLYAASERLGDIALRSNSWDVARTHYETALKIGRDALTESPGNDSARRNIWNARLKAADAATRNGNTADARAHLEAAITVAEQRAKAFPDDIRYPQALALTYKRMGEIAVSMNDLTTAKRVFSSALELYRNVAIGVPDSDAKREVVRSYYRLADVDNRLGDKVAAQAGYEAGVKLAEQVAAEDSQNAGIRLDLALGQEKLGGIAMKSKQ